MSTDSLELGEHWRSNPNPERNNTCPCGSKIKYKKCCLRNKRQPKELDADIGECLHPEEED